MWPFLLCSSFERMTEKRKQYDIFRVFEKHFIDGTYKYGKSAANRYLIMYIYPNQTERNRLGISVSKKVGNSVVRHRLARLIRESYRLSETRFHSGYDIVVIARPVAKDKNYFEVESALLHLGKVHKIAG